MILETRNLTIVEECDQQDTPNQLYRVIGWEATGQGYQPVVVVQEPYGWSIEPKLLVKKPANELYNYFMIEEI